MKCEHPDCYREAANQWQRYCSVRCEKAHAADALAEEHDLQRRLDDEDMASNN